MLSYLESAQIPRHILGELTFTIPSSESLLSRVKTEPSTIATFSSLSSRCVFALPYWKGAVVDSQSLSSVLRDRCSSMFAYDCIRIGNTRKIIKQNHQYGGEHSYEGHVRFGYLQIDGTCAENIETVGCEAMRTVIVTTSTGAIPYGGKKAYVNGKRGREDVMSEILERLGASDARDSFFPRFCGSVKSE